MAHSILSSRELSLRRRESTLMWENDPLRGDPTAVALGPHLGWLSRSEARLRVESRARSLRAGVGAQKRDARRLKPRSLESFEDLISLQQYMAELGQMIGDGLKHVESSLGDLRGTVRGLKEDITVHSMEKRHREEEVVNWSFVLKYLLDANSGLRKRLKVRLSGRLWLLDLLIERLCPGRH
jgi:hypothetical protein